MKNFIQGFSLIEILLVITIIAILSGVGAIGYNQFRTRAKITVAKIEMKQVVDTIVLAKTISGKTLRRMWYGDGCTAMDPCSTNVAVPGNRTSNGLGPDLRNTPKAANGLDACYSNWLTMLNGIGKYAQLPGFKNGYTDASGNFVNDSLGAPVCSGCPSICGGNNCASLGQFTRVESARVLERDPWGSPYILEIHQTCFSNSCNDEKIWSVGPNGVDDAGGGDDIMGGIIPRGANGCAYIP